MQHNISSMYADFTDYWFPTLKIGYADEQAYKPQIIITGEKTNSVVQRALEKYTTQKIVWISLNKLEVESKNYDLNKDILLLLIHKCPGNNPVRGFQSFDGPLHCYKDPIFRFKKRGAVVIPHSLENGNKEEIQKQANRQLTEDIKNQVIVTSGLWRSLFDIALDIQTFFKDSDSSPIAKLVPSQIPTLVKECNSSPPTKIAPSEKVE